MKGYLKALLTFWGSLARSSRRRIALIGLCIALAIAGGSLAAMTARLLSVTKTNFLVKPLALVAPGIACLTGVFVAGLAHRADPGGWWGYLVRVSVSAVCALVSGIWMEQLAKFLIGESQLTGRLVSTVTNSTVDPVELSLSMSRFCCLSFALLTAVVLGRKRRWRSPVCDLG